MTLCRRKIELAATLEKATNVVIRYERAQGLLLADCAPTVGWGKTFWAWTKSVVIVGHFFDGQDGPTNFC